MNEPAHHARYRRAWELYCDPTCSSSNKKILEKESTVKVKEEEEINGEAEEKFEENSEEDQSEFF